MKNERILSSLKTSVFMTSCFILLLLCVSNPHSKAASLMVSSTSDGAITSFRDAVMNAASGDTITFAALTNGMPQSLSLGEIVINKNLVILGNGNTQTLLDGAMLSRILNIMPPATAVFIKGIEFSDGVSLTLGGAIFNQSVNTRFIGCIIKNSVAQGAAANEGGGGIANDGGIVTLTDNTLISNNSAPGTLGSGGGILSTTGTIEMINSSINDNSASRAGGGIEIIDGSLNIVNSNIKNNLLTVNPAPGNGGGIHISGSSVSIEIETSAIDGNIAASQGGGIWIQAGSVLNVSETQITNNIANGNAIGDGGGGIFNQGGFVAITDVTTILRNRANGGGGGILSTGGTVSLGNSFVSSNYCAMNGGGINNNGVLDMIDVNMESDTAGNSGGALYNSGNTFMESTTIGNNSAIQSGGGIDQQDGTAIITIESSFVVNNTSGTCGGTCIAAGTANISNTSLSSTLGAAGGDILRIEVGAKSDIINSTVTQ